MWWSVFHSVFTSSVELRSGEVICKPQGRNCRMYNSKVVVLLLCRSGVLLVVVVVVVGFLCVKLKFIKNPSLTVSSFKIFYPSMCLPTFLIKKWVASMLWHRLFICLYHIPNCTLSIKLSQCITITMRLARNQGGVPLHIFPKRIYLFSQQKWNNKFQTDWPSYLPELLQSLSTVNWFCDSHSTD